MEFTKGLAECSHRDFLVPAMQDIIYRLRSMDIRHLGFRGVCPHRGLIEISCSESWDSGRDPQNDGFHMFQCFFQLTEPVPVQEFEETHAQP